MKRIITILFLVAVVVLSSAPSSFALCSSYYWNGTEYVCDPVYYVIFTSSVPSWCDYPPGTKVFIMWENYEPVAWYFVPANDDLTQPPDGFDPNPSIVMQCGG